MWKGVSELPVGPRRSRREARPDSALRVRRPGHRLPCEAPGRSRPFGGDRLRYSCSKSRPPAGAAGAWTCPARHLPDRRRRRVPAGAPAWQLYSAAGRRGRGGSDLRPRVRAHRPQLRSGGPCALHSLWTASLERFAAIADAMTIDQLADEWIIDRRSGDARGHEPRREFEGRRHGGVAVRSQQVKPSWACPAPNIRWWGYLPGSLWSSTVATPRTRAASVSTTSAEGEAAATLAR